MNILLSRAALENNTKKYNLKYRTFIGILKYTNFSQKQSGKEKQMNKKQMEQKENKCCDSINLNTNIIKLNVNGLTTAIKRQ